ncbi:MAG: polysaccharide deacetylase family protein [Spirochaetales bacterium]
MKSLTRLFATLCLFGSLEAEVVFSGLDLNPASSLVFQANHSPWSGDAYGLWYKADLAAGTPAAAALEPLTFFPETAAWLPRVGQLQIQNGFGVWRLDPNTLAVKSVAPRSFEKRNPLGEGRDLPIQFSPDGQYALTFDRVSPAIGDLVLFDVGKDTSLDAAVGLDLSWNAVPALWSPDSQFFVYEKKGELYYYSLRQAKEKRVPEESLRRLGPGMLSSVTWSSGGELYYVVDEVLYRILPEEFFTRSLYKGQFQTWGIKGKLPFPFLPSNDAFWIDPEGQNVLFNLGGRTLFYYPLEYLDFYQSKTLAPLTYLPLPQNLTIRKVLWGKDGKITLLTSSLTRGKDETQVLRLTATGTQVLPSGEAPVLDLAFSPDESWILVSTAKGVSLREASGLAEKKTYNLEGLTAAFWMDQNTLLACSKLATVKISLLEGTVKTLLLSTLDQVGTSDVGGLAGRQGKSWYLWQGKGQWKLSGIELKVADAQTANNSFRVYTDELSSGSYRNWVLVRNLKALTTTPLFPQPAKPYDGFPAVGADSLPKGDGVSAPFVHGSRQRSLEVAITIDALDSPEGLPQVLRAFRDWGFKTTFFVNGEFLRRNPQASQEIAQSPHEVGNLFHIPFDLTTPGFVIDSSFVKQGLARQEDDWFHVTGKELSLLWHPPGWVEAPALLAGAREANYRTVGRDVVVNTGFYREADVSKLIEQVLADKLPGSVIPLTLGMKDSKTGESFFNRLDLLLNALVEAGYNVVPVSQLMDKSRK